MSGNETCLLTADRQNGLSVIAGGSDDEKVKAAVGCLKQDRVALMASVTQMQADQLVLGISRSFGLADSLELQAAFAGHLGHRHRIGSYFMSVNQREDFEFITPHCEGSSFAGMQLAAFFCDQNTSDGGETVLLNIDGSSPCWAALREKAVRGKSERRALTRQEISRVRALHQLQWPANMLQDQDEVLREYPSDFPGLMLFDVLARPKACYSCVLERDVMPYWDTVAIIDFDAADEFARFLKQRHLLKEPPYGCDVARLDNDRKFRIMRSGIEFARFFQREIIYKMAPGDLIVLNNMTWAHAANNWSPSSGTRRVAAAFA